MDSSIAESLAKAVLEGTYTPSALAECKPDLPIDQNPHVVRFTQFLLFSNPEQNVRSPKELNT